MKKFLRLFFFAALMLITFGSFVGCGEQSDFAGGDGSAENPYRIKNATQLMKVNIYPDANYILVGNINMKKVEYTAPSEFRGNFNGDGHTIYNLTIRESKAFSEVKVGLFKTNYGTIQNLSLLNCSIVSSPRFGNNDITVYCGAIAGINEGVIENCKVIDSTVIGNSSDLADIFMEQYKVDPRQIDKNSKHWKTWIHQSFDISTSAWNANLTFDVSTGGIAGFNNGTISNTTFTGEVQSNLYNMLASSNMGNTNIISSSCYAGGITGLNSGVLEQVTVEADIFAWIELDHDAGGDGWVVEIYPYGTCYACGLAGRNIAAADSVNGKATGGQLVDKRLYAPAYKFLLGADYSSATRARIDNLTYGTSTTYR